MKYVVGIDGGGTKSIFRAANLKGEPVGEVWGGPTNINALDITQVKQNLQSALANLLEINNLNPRNCAALCLGTAGVDTEEYKLQVTQIIKDLQIGEQILVTNDTITALVAGCGKQEGIIVIAGTGSVSLGIDANGEMFQSGGWGHIIGDEGSGFWIGRQALIEAVKSSDGRQEKTALLEMLLKQLGLSHPKDFMKFVFAKTTGKQEIAALSSLVDEAHRAGDKVATQILKQAALDNFLAAHAVIENLDFHSNQITIVVHGSVLINNTFVFEQFSSMLKNKYPGAKIFIPQKDAAWGAIQLALQLIKCD